MMTQTRKKYDKEFKQKAVELAAARGNTAEVAEELGIKADLLYRWRREHGQYDKNSFPGQGKAKMTDQEREIAQLKKELRDAKMERDILKKAISIFSVSDGKSTNS
jgi:transposase